MTWNNPVITGSRSVSQNKDPLNQNADYTQVVMRNDHFWSEDPTRDGRHQWVQMPKIDPAPFSLSAGMDGGFWVEDRAKVSGNENIPLFKNTEGHESLLGTRAAVNFSRGGGPLVIHWQHNVSAVNRTGEGQYDIVFSTALPSNNYVVNITPFRDNFIFGSIRNDSDWNNVATANLLRIFFFDQNTALKDPIRCTVSIMGG